MESLINNLCLDILSKYLYNAYTKSKGVFMAKRTLPKIKTVSTRQSAPKTKRTQIVHKKDMDVKNLYQLMAETEKTIQELTRTLAELPSSRHRSVGGKTKLTAKEQLVVRELSHARTRAQRILKLIELSSK